LVTQYPARLQALTPSPEKTYNVAGTKVYNLASGGATTDAKLVTPYLPTVLSFVDQVDQWTYVLYFACGLLLV